MKPNDSIIPILADRLSYDPVTGVLRWRNSARQSARWNSRYSFEVAGRVKSDGYITIRATVAGKKYNVLAHRVAFFICTDRIPRDEIDHINGNRSDNRACNLAEATRADNARNQKVRDNSKSGYHGVIFRSSKNKWQAKGKHAGEDFHLGYFSKVEDAINAARKFRADLKYSDRHINP